MRIEIHVSQQRLTLFREATPILACAISTSFAGTGSEPGSNRTPLGNFVIGKKIGAGAALGAVFRSRVDTGESASRYSTEDQVATRVLWLDGVDSENANTRERYIYLHGTNHEEQLGWPVSHGCIRLANIVMADVFELVEPGTPVLIGV